MLNVSLKILNNKIGSVYPLPTYAKNGDAGMDLIACIDEPITIAEGENILIPTGIAIHINDPNVFAAILPRSGLGHKAGLVLGNLVGVIDSNYQGELLISAWNRKHVSYTVNTEASAPETAIVQNNNSVTINPGDRIAQLLFLPVLQAQFTIVSDFEQSDRGDGGFGSTGIVHDNNHIERQAIKIIEECFPYATESLVDANYKKLTLSECGIDSLDCEELSIRVEENFNLDSDVHFDTHDTIHTVAHKIAVAIGG